MIELPFIRKYKNKYSSVEDKVQKYLSSRIHKSWLDLFNDAEIALDIYKTIARILNTYPNKDKSTGYRYRMDRGKKIYLYPSPNNILAAFRYTSLDDLKVVMVGQDPYPSHMHATGLAFGVREDLQRIPPSLKIIFEELANYRSGLYGDDPINAIEKLRIGASAIAPKNSEYAAELERLKLLQHKDEIEAARNTPMDKTLRSWTTQGVLLLNTSLTVETGKIGIHFSVWRDIIGAILNEITEYNKDVILANIGSQARELTVNYFLQVPMMNFTHPSYDVRTGFNKFRLSGIFNKVNKTLVKQKKEEIIW